MHANTEQLLSLRDGEPATVEVRAHVEGCERCLRELRSLSGIREILRLPHFVEDDACEYNLRNTPDGPTLVRTATPLLLSHSRRTSDRGDVRRPSYVLQNSFDLLLRSSSRSVKH